MEQTHLRAVECDPRRAASRDAFPFTVPAVRSLERLDLSAAVTFFVGENGSGKSTLLEGIAAAAGLPAVGSADIDADATLRPQRSLAKAFKLVWNRRTHRGFFLRAEDFFGFTRRLSGLRAELGDRLQEVTEEYKDRSAFTRGLAEGPLRGSLSELTRRYGADLDANSHGESFLKLFEARLVPGGLYLMDEPEAALSPQNQLGLLAILKSMVEQDAQFIIATHSPIVLAHPGARIYSFDTTPVSSVAYEELDHVVLTRAFLNDPERFLRQL
jgi:predicted ATPase